MQTNSPRRSKYLAPVNFNSPPKYIPITDKIAEKMTRTLLDCNHFITLNFMGQVKLLIRYEKAVAHMDFNFQIESWYSAYFCCVGLV